MEVRPGYKRTEVGVIPEDWDVSTVGSEFSVQLGKMLDAEKNLGIPKPYLGNKAVQWDSIDSSDLPTVPMSREDLGKFRLRKGEGFHFVHQVRQRHGVAISQPGKSRYWRDHDSLHPVHRSTSRRLRSSSRRRASRSGR